jgi:hypothetical protein
MTTALEGGEWSAARPGRTLPPGKTWYPLYRRLGGPQGRSGQVQKISPPPGFDPRTVQPVVSHYTDWATGTTKTFFVYMEIQMPYDLHYTEFDIHGFCFSLTGCKPYGLLLFNIVCTVHDAKFKSIPRIMEQFEGNKFNWYKDTLMMALKDCRNMCSHFSAHKGG